VGKHSTGKGEISTYHLMGNRINRDHEGKHRAEDRNDTQPLPKTGTGAPAGSDLPSRGQDS
jgi:hypothetical protein